MRYPLDAYGREVYADRPVAYLRLDETQDVVVPDFMDLYGGTHSTPGPTAGQSPLILSGKSVAYANSGETTLTTMGTFGQNLLTSSCEFWIKTTATSGPLAAFGTVNQADQLIYACFVNSRNQLYVSGAVELQIRDNAGGHLLASTANVGINDGNAHHVVFVATSTTAIVCYVDGVEQTVGYQFGGTGPFANSASPFAFPMTLGARNLRGTMDRRLTGTLDEVAFYITRLTASRVAAHYNARALVDATGPSPTRSIWLKPTGVGSGGKEQWIDYGGAGTDWQAVSKDVVPGVDTPSPTTGITVTNTTAIDQFSFESLAGKVNPGEHVAYLRPWAYLRANNGSVNLFSQFGVGSRTFAGTGWKAGMKHSPFSARQTDGFPTTPVLDTFNRADGALGANWGNQGPSPPSIVSNQARGDVTGFMDVWWDAAKFSGNTEAYATVGAKATTGSAGVYIGVLQNPSATVANVDGYQVGFRFDTNQWQITRYDNSGQTLLTSTAGTLNVGDKFGIRVRNGNVTAFRHNGTSWASVLSTVDDTYSFAGGCYAELASYDAGGLIRIDDFGGGIVAPASGRLVDTNVGSVELDTSVAATVDCSAVMLEVGVSAVEHLVPYGKDLVGAKTATPFRGTFAQYGSVNFDPLSLTSDNVDGVRSNFRAMRDRGLDSVRLFLQFGSFMTSSTVVNEYQWQKVERGLTICDEEGIRVDITGLVTYLPGNTDFVPAWLDALSEADRWTTFALWWQRCARAAAGHPSVMVFDILSEPLTQDGGTAWYPAGSLTFNTYLNKNLSGRTAAQVFAAFHDKMLGTVSEGIRSGDPIKPTSFGALYPDIADHVARPATAVLMHYYPAWDATQAALNIDETLIQPRNVPMVIEEMGAHRGTGNADPQGMLQALAIMQRMRWRNYAAGGPNWKGALDGFDSGKFGDDPTTYKPNIGMMFWAMSAVIFGRYAKEDERVSAVRPISGRIGQRFT